LIIGGGVLALALLGFGGHVLATSLASKRAMTPRALGNATPASVSIPFTRVSVQSGDRTLIGWWVRARAATGTTAPAVLFLHGNASSISDYVTLQRFFYRQGVSTMVFDYTGFGASGGTASLPNAVEDAGNVAKVFSDSAGAARKVAMGSALGATVLLQAIDSVQPRVNGIVLEGVDASVRESAVRAGRLPSVWKWYIKDIGNNVEAAANVRVPTLLVQSREDKRTPFEDAQAVAAAIPARNSLVKHWRKGHAAIVSTSRACDWAPVLAFVRTGTLPAAKVDSTDVCAAEKAAADSAKAAAAAKAAAQTKAAPRGTKRR
jgi:alpha-beta hydrolase superfamily lysophospholipase